MDFMVNEFDLNRIVEPLQNWFHQNARVLPWRDEPSAYHVWVSEIMLQQTRVEAVKPFFERFIMELPDVRALANCSTDRLLKLWEGLGYYNRVKNMNLAAIQVMEEYHGELPRDYHALLGLKGIGSYTAGAISSIAYGLPYPAVDGNVFRVLSRVTRDDSDITKQSVKAFYEKILLDLMNQPDTQVKPSVFNQALMELGATVCVPNGEPHCECCPLRDICQAYEQQDIHHYPVKKSARKRRIEKKTILVLVDDKRIAITKRGEKGLLAGLFELPNLEGHLSENEVLDFVKQQGFQPLRIQEMNPGKHIFSHVEWDMIGYQIRIEEPEVKEHPWLFVGRDGIQENYAIPTAFRGFLHQVEEKIK